MFKHYSLYTDILINSIILDTYMQENNRGCMKYNSLVWILANWFLVRLITEGNLFYIHSSLCLIDHNYEIDGGSGPLGPPLLGPCSWSSLCVPLGLVVRKEVGLSRNITIAKTIHIIAIIIKLLSPESWEGPGNPSY